MNPRRRPHDDLETPVPPRREEQLEELLEHGSRNFRRYRRRAYVAFGILAVANAIAFQKIDASRKDTIRRSCLESNKRHDDTIRQLDTEIARLADPARRVRAEQSKRVTVRLIDNLAPRRDCDKRADDLVRPAN